MKNIRQRALHAKIQTHVAVAAAVNGVITVVVICQVHVSRSFLPHMKSLSRHCLSIVLQKTVIKQTLIFCRHSFQRGAQFPHHCLLRVL
jgi:hypothetical protein